MIAGGLTEPGGRQPAPGALRLVQSFVNTVDLEDGSDALAAPDDLAAWLAGHGLGTALDDVSGADHRLALDVREALRALLRGHDGEPIDGVALAVLDRAGRQCGLRVSFAGDIHLEPAATGVSAGLAELLAVVHDAARDGSWRRLKACSRDACQWVFYDRSKNRSSRWCAMSVCGTREKMAAYRRRA